MSALIDIRARIAIAEADSGRFPGSVTLIAVSKVQPGERVEAVLQEGQRVFGENYVQEAQGKWPTWRAIYPGVKLHMIGPLQSNKARLAVEMFDAIHTVDRPSLADKLARAVQTVGRLPALFVQVNIGAEPQKAGVAPQDAENFVQYMRQLDLAPTGLMCIPPEGEDPILHFRRLTALATDVGVTGLSMGMSSDFEAAIAEGATHVRVGSALFGARDYT